MTRTLVGIVALLATLLTSNVGEVVLVISNQVSRGSLSTFSP